MKYVIALLIIAATNAYGSPTGCERLVVNGTYPVIQQPVEKTTVLCRRMYVVEHSPSLKTPYWSAERVSEKDLHSFEKRVNAFKRDPDLPADEAALPQDYDLSGSNIFDKGHMSPVGDMHSDKEAMLESFYMSNMVPQYIKHNRGIWKVLERKVREYTLAKGELYVITGPIYSAKPVHTIGISRVAVPDYLYKIMYDVKTNNALVILTPNVSNINSQDLPAYVTTLSEVERISGIKFFPNLPVQPTSKSIFEF